MATSYTGLRVQDTYNAIIKIGDNSNLTSTPKLLSDGLGNDSPLYLSGTRLGIGISPTYQFQTSGNAKIGGNLIIAGDLTVNGSTTIVDSTIVAIGDNMIEMAKDNVANTMDIGWYGTIVESGTKYVGTYYDAGSGVTTPTFYIGLGTTEPSSTAAWTVKGKIVIGQLDATGGTITGNLSVTGTIADSDGDVGTSGQILSSTATGTNWVDFDAETAKRTEILVKNVEGSSLVKGDPVYIVGSVGASERLEVGLCDSSDSSKMPCVGLLTQNLANNGEGTAIVTGKLKNLVTSPIDGVTPTENDTLFVKPGGSSGSALTTTKPTANNHLIQNVGQVGRVSTSSDGNIVVSAIMRTNDVPNQIDRNVNFTDNSKLTFGDSTTPDLEIYHDVTNSHIINTTGDLTIDSQGDDLILKAADDALLYVQGTDIAIQAVGDGKVGLRYDNVEKLATTSTGISVTGNATFAGGIQVTSPGSSFYTIFESGDDYVIGLNDYNGVNQWWFKAYTNGNFAIHENGVGDKFTIAAGGNATFAGEVTAVKYDVSNTSGYLVREDTGSGYGLFKSSTTNIGIASNGNVALNFDSSSNATFANDIYGNLIELQGYGFKGGEGDILDSSTFGKSGIGNTFRWVEQNSASTGSTWRKVCDVTLNTSFFDGVQMEVVVYQPNTNWGDSASFIKNYYSVAFRGSQSDVGPSYEDAIVYGINADLLRVYKVSTNNYELQARSSDDNRDLVVEYTITSKNNAKVTPNNSYTDGTTSGGTAYTASANSNTKTKFAGEVEFQGTTIGDDLRVNGILYLGAGADTTYGGYLTNKGAANEGISMKVQDNDGFDIYQVWGNAGEASLSFEAVDEAVKLYYSGTKQLETYISGTKLYNKVLIDANGTGNTVEVWDDLTTGQPGFMVTNTGSQSTSTHTLYLKNYNSGITANVFGTSIASKSIIASADGGEGLLFGTLVNKPIWIGTNNTAALTLDGTTQAATFADNIDTAEDKRISVGAWDNSGFGSGQMYGFSVTSTTPLLHLTESDQTNKKGYIGLSGGNMYVGGLITDFYLQTGSGSTALVIDSNQDAHFIGNVELGDGTDISMDASANGQLMIDGNGYQGAIAVGASGMAIYHNSSSRDLILGTNETARLTIDGGGSGSTFSTTYLTVGGEGYIRSDDSGYLHFQGASTGTRFYNNSNNVANFTILDNGTATFAGGVTSASLSAASIGVSGSNGTDGKGISLYGGANSGEPTYGMMFMQTATSGTMGYVSGDWATYFTMNNTLNRGWIFRKVGVGNVASINNDGKATFGTPSKFYTNDSELFIEDAGTNAVRIGTGAGNELYIGGDNTWQFRGTTTGQAQINSVGYFSITAGAANYTGVELRETDGNLVGYIYGDSGSTANPGIGFLDSDGFWAIRASRDSYVEFRVNNIIKLQTTTSINYNYQPTWIEGGSANWNESTPGLATGSLHLDPGSSSDNFGSAITFGASDSAGGTTANAGIYSRTDGSYGTKMYFATTDSYAYGSKTRMMIDYNGNVGIGTNSPRGILDISKVDGPELFLTRNDGSVAPDDLIGSLTFYNEDADGTHRSSWVRGYATETFGRKGYLSFATASSNSTDATEKMRINQYGQLLINATSSGYGSNNYGYNLGVRGNTTQAFISIARDTQTLDTQGVIIGLDTNHSYFINRDVLPIEFYTNNTVRMHIHGSANQVGIGADPVSQAGVNNFLMIKGSAHSGIVLEDTDNGAVHEMWNDGGTLNMWDSSIGFRMRFYTNGNAQVYNGLSADSIGVSGSNGNDGKGLSLYGGSVSGEPTYGMMFMQTATFGTYGSVTGGWATYFTMNNDTTRGWIFRRVGSGNCASINAAGDLSLNGQINFPNTNMRLLGNSSSYLRIQSGSASESGIEFQNTSGTILGYFYGNTTKMGMYNNSGYDVFKATPGVSGITTIYKGDGITKIEAGDNVNIYHGTGFTQFNSNRYIYTQSWINLGSGAGIFSGTNGAHFYPNNSGLYGTWRINGSRGGYTGINMAYTAETVIGMFDSSGNGGTYDSTTGWHTYYYRANACLAVGGSTTSSSYSLYVTGSIYSTQDVIAYSDKRAKENIVTVDSAIEKVNKLRGVYYTPKEGEDKSRKVGVIAQEILEVLPEVVTHDKENDRYGVDYGKITGLLIEAIKDQQKQIDKLTKFVDKLNK